MPAEGLPRGLVSRWLCPTELQRLRFLDMHKRVKTARRVQGATCGAAALVSAPFFGWWLVGLVVLTALSLGILERVYRTSAQPEIASATSIAVLELIIAVCVAGTGGTTSPMLSFLCIPALMLAARFRLQNS